MLLRAKHAERADRPIVIWSPDTDVAIMCISHSFNIRSALVFVTGTGNRRRLINIPGIANHLGVNICNTLPGFHALTGCDSTSSLYGRGKPSSFKTLLNGNSQLLEALGSSWTISDESLAKVEEFVCKLYGSSNNCVNSTRYQLFCFAASSEKALPPNKDALHQHIKRCNYQTAVWRNALEQFITPPSPVDHGWKMADGCLAVAWLGENISKPSKIPALVSCSCQKNSVNLRDALVKKQDLSVHSFAHALNAQTKLQQQICQTRLLQQVIWNQEMKTVILRI